MSVVIKGAKMPQNCEECDCYITAAYYFPWCCLNKTNDLRIDEAETGRPDWCPLGEVEDDK